jgi:hypothetical protein
VTAWSCTLVAVFDDDSDADDPEFDDSLLVAEWLVELTLDNDSLKSVELSATQAERLGLRLIELALEAREAPLGAQA